MYVHTHMFVCVRELYNGMFTQCAHDTTSNCLFKTRFDPVCIRMTRTHNMYRIVHTAQLAHACIRTYVCCCLSRHSLHSYQLLAASVTVSQRLTCLHASTSTGRPGAATSREGEGGAYLRQWKVGAEAKMDQLQTEVQRRVPPEELEVLEEQFRDLSTKYQGLVQRHGLLLQRTEAAEQGAGQEVWRGGERRGGCSAAYIHSSVSIG